MLITLLYAVLIFVAAAAAFFLLLPKFTMKAPITDFDLDHLYAPKYDSGLLGHITGHGQQNWDPTREVQQAVFDWAHETRNAGKKAYLWRVLCFRYAVVAIDVRDFNHILHSNGLNYDKPRHIYKDALEHLMGEDGVLTCPNPPTNQNQHSRLRKVIGPAFAQRHVADVYGETHIASNVADLIKKLDALAGEATLEHRDGFESMTLQIAAETLYSNKNDKNADELAKCYRMLTQAFMTDHARLIAPPAFLRPILSACSTHFRDLYARVNSTTASIRRLVNLIVNKTKQENKPMQHDKTVVDLMARAAAEGQLSPKEIEDNAIQVTIAAAETSANTLLWITLYLSHNRKVQDELAEELRELASLDAVPNLSDVSESNAPLLDAVIRETLRLVPAVAVLAREAVKDDVWPSGVKVKAGQEVDIPIHWIQADPTIWGADAETWRPARWLDKDYVSKLPQCAWIPFSAGLRDCLGRHLAMAELRVGVAAVFRRFSVEPVDKEFPKRHLAFTTRPGTYPRLKFTKRSA